VEAPIIVDKMEAEIKERQEKGLLSSGLAEQFSLQLSALRDEGSPDFELVAFPGFFTAISELCLLIT
jgi:hypothetical protein